MGTSSVKPAWPQCEKCGGTCISVYEPDGTVRKDTTWEDEYGRLLGRVVALEAERQHTLDCINLFGDETLHDALDAAGLLMDGREGGK